LTSNNAINTKNKAGFQAVSVALSSSQQATPKQAAKKNASEQFNQPQKPIKQEPNFIYMLDSDADADDDSSDVHEDDDESDDESSEYGLSDDYDDDIVNEAGDERECGSDSDDMDDESDDIDSTIDDESSSSLTNSSWSHSMTKFPKNSTTMFKSTPASESNSHKTSKPNQSTKTFKSECNSHTKAGSNNNNDCTNTAQSSSPMETSHVQQQTHHNLKRSRIAYQQTSGYSSDNPAEKRAFHILSERQRRNDLKKLFETLRVNVPSLNDKQKASKLTILKASVDYLNEINNKQMKLNLTYEKEKQKHLQLMHNLKVLQANSK
jgi:hypothetical protein